MQIPPEAYFKMKLIFIGPPGCGKGSNAKLTSKEFNIPQISMGDILRAIVKSGSELGKKIAGIIDKGNLIPNDVTLEILQDRLKQEDCENGYILDGYPRNIGQAQDLDKITDIDKVLFISCSEDSIIQRLSGRRVCKKCGKIYHILNMPPKKAGVCDKCEGELEQRHDDSEEVIKHRLKVYHEETLPLIKFYEEKGILEKVDANPPIEEVFEQIKKILKH